LVVGVKGGFSLGGAKGCGSTKSVVCSLQWVENDNYVRGAGRGRDLETE
jgi:hypothetical protein